MYYLRAVKSYKNTNDPQRSFVTAYVEKHSQKNQFFNDVKKIINWNKIDDELKKVYKIGLTDKGAKAYSPLLLFKMHLISVWYDLSDIQTETMVNDSLSAIKFCDLTLEDNVPGHSTLSRFKKELTDQGALENIFEKINDQLISKNLKIIKGRAKVDARLTSN